MKKLVSIAFIGMMAMGCGSGTKNTPPAGSATNPPPAAGADQNATPAGQNATPPGAPPAQ